MAIPGDAPSKARYHHGDLRRVLLEAALQLVTRLGVEGFSLREAAREVGVSPAAVYRHFADRSALLAALAMEGMGQLAEAMERALERVPGSPGSPARAAAGLGAVGVAYVEFAVRHPSYFRVMFGPWCDRREPGALPPEAQPRGRDAYQILVDTLDGLVRSGAVLAEARAGAEIAAWSAVHGLAGLLVSGALPLGAAERAQALALVQRTLLLGLGCDPALLGAGSAVTAAGGRAAKGRGRAAPTRRSGPPPPRRP